jgi:hypothetical protein
MRDLLYLLTNSLLIGFSDRDRPSGLSSSHLFRPSSLGTCSLLFAFFRVHVRRWPTPCSSSTPCTATRWR